MTDMMNTTTSGGSTSSSTTATSFESAILSWTATATTTTSDNDNDNNNNNNVGIWNHLLFEMNDTIMNTYKVQKEQSLAARKTLGETTKRFKKYVKAVETENQDANNNNNNANNNNNNIDLLTKECKVTIKQYQEEIDNLTRRCKLSEQSYMNLFHTLQNLPDPAWIIQQLQLQQQQQQQEILQQQKQQEIQLQQQQKQLLEEKETIIKALEQENKKLQKELKTAVTTASTTTTSSTSTSNTGLSKEEYNELIKLRREVNEYEVEFRSLKNQDITIRKLEAKIEELQTSGMEALQNAIEQTKTELAIREGQKAADALEREAIAERKVQQLELLLASERAGIAASQNIMLEEYDAIQNLKITYDAQKQILVDDNTRLKEQIHQLQIQLQNSNNSSSITSPGSGNYMNNNNNSNPTDSSNNMNMMTGTTTTSSSSSITKQDLLLERSAYEAEVAELSETNTLLRDEIRNKENQYQQFKKEYEVTINTLQDEKNNLLNKCNLLQIQLDNSPSQSYVDSMKRELRILKRLEYNVHDTTTTSNRDPEMTGDEFDLVGGTAMMSSSSLSGNNNNNNVGGGLLVDENDLESVLVAKLQKAESELVTERTSKQEIQQQMEILQKELKDMYQAKKDADELIVSLEKDLERATTTTNNNNNNNNTLPIRTLSSSNTNILPLPQSSNNNNNNNSSLLSSILDPDGQPKKEQQQQHVAPDPPTATAVVVASGSTSTDNINSTVGGGGSSSSSEHSVATIVMAQRDRLRVRCEQLEAERDSFKRELQAQVQISESFKSDNAKLYEKVRYLQNYNTSSVGTNNKQQRMYNRSSSMNNNMERDLDLEALEQRYEASVDPFKQFNKAERQRKLNEMSPMERTVFIVAKTVLSTKQMRTGLFIYVVSLHLLVFITTYHWSHSGDECGRYYHDHNLMAEHLSHLPPALPAHIQNQIIAKDAAADAAMGAKP